MNSIARTGRLISTILWLVLALYGSCSRTIAAQRDPNCKRPAELARALAKQPSAAAYDALGAYFGQRTTILVSPIWRAEMRNARLANSGPQCDSNPNFRNRTRHSELHSAI